MAIRQIEINLTKKKRGFHVITDEIINSLKNLPEFGLCQLFMQHTSAGLSLNEQADPSVLVDLNNWFDRNIRENENYYTHTYEGLDDMPAHIKSVLTGCEITIPIRHNELALGVWQGIYLAEFRNHANNRKIIATISY
jgi:secondary thiamine-phosphate synthase enzyme